MRIIDADKFLEDMKSTDRYFMVKFDIERAPTVDLWHYPSKGELPNCTQRVFVLYGREERMKVVWWRDDLHRFGNMLPTEITAWQYLSDLLPKEEA